MVELLVGLTIGLMTIAVAIGTLMISRQVSGAVSEASQLQQQAAQAFRTIGQQARQAGSLRLNLAYAKDAAQAVDVADPVAFEVPAGLLSVTGKNTPSATDDQLTLAYPNYTESLVGNAVQSQLRDCLGQGKGQGVIRSGFSLDKATGATSGELECKGSDGSTQPVIENVADFRVRFLDQAGTFGSPTMRSRVPRATLSLAQFRYCVVLSGRFSLPSISRQTSMAWIRGQSVAVRASARGCAWCCATPTRFAARVGHGRRSHESPPPARHVVADRDRDRIADDADGRLGGAHGLVQRGVIK